MTTEEMVTAIKSNNITGELVEALVEFEWELDPYGTLDAYGHPDDPDVRKAMREDILYALKECPQGAIDYITGE